MTIWNAHATFGTLVQARMRKRERWMIALCAGNLTWHLLKLLRARGSSTVFASETSVSENCGASTSKPNFVFLVCKYNTTSVLLSAKHRDWNGYLKFIKKFSPYNVTRQCLRQALPIGNGGRGFFSLLRENFSLVKGSAPQEGLTGQESSKEWRSAPCTRIQCWTIHLEGGSSAFVGITGNK